jgi:hypothetical protein
MSDLVFVSVAEFKKHVPGLSRQTIRRMAREGALVCVMSGNRAHINLHASLEKLKGYSDGPWEKPEKPLPPVAEKDIPPILRRNPKYPGRLPDKVRLAQKEKTACWEQAASKDKNQL